MTAVAAQGIGREPYRVVFLRPRAESLRHLTPLVSMENKGEQSWITPFAICMFIFSLGNQPPKKVIQVIHWVGPGRYCRGHVATPPQTACPMPRSLQVSGIGGTLAPTLQKPQEEPSTLSESLLNDVPSAMALYGLVGGFIHGSSYKCWQAYKGKSPTLGALS